MRSLNIQRSVIYSDSKSALASIVSVPDPGDDHVTYLVKQSLGRLHMEGFDNDLAWIPGHTGIEGNVMANYLANLGRSCADKLDFHLGYREYLPTIKKQIWESSQTQRGSRMPSWWRGF